MIAELSKIKGSLGSAAMIASGSTMIASMMPIETYNQVYETSPDMILSGSSQPAGTAEVVPGGWRVSGR